MVKIPQQAGLDLGFSQNSPSSTCADHPTQIPTSARHRQQQQERKRSVHPSPSTTVRFLIVGHPDMSAPTQTLLNQRHCCLEIRLR
ncbi:hypothetical protein ACLOJK_028608 [Asimina triloba]